ncbi:sensor histidine kinase [Pseudolysinimonas sp.]|uniref:sensor histidine kinase n=1 Tax=Pseudolysinimonas sp. TaxID=2680009 RepID=UPI003F7DE49D
MDASSPRLLPPPTRQVRTPLSLARVDAAVSRSAGAIGIVFFLQSAPVLFGQLHDTTPVWTGVVIALIVLSLLAALVASVAGRFVQYATVAFAAVFLVVMLSWPFAVVHPNGDSPWFYYLMTVATGMAAIGLSVQSATVYLFAVPTLYAALRLTSAGGGLSPLKVTLDSVYSLMLGGAILILVTMLRSASSHVDAAQATALDRYSIAVRQHATEAERVRVDAIVHDSVLTTLLTAARAYDPEAKAFAASQAAAAIAHLREAALVTPDDGSVVRIALVADGIRDAVKQLAAPFAVSIARLGPRAIPSVAGEAMHAAAVQAAVNSVNHAGPDAHRSLRITDHDGALHVEIIDDGVGFEPARVPRERLGVRVSIIERLANAGGRADIRTAPGAGTTIELVWPAEPEAAP